MHPRLGLIDLPASRAASTLCDHVYKGLSASPKFLPCHFFYDREGSLLFEQITKLPEYYLTRSEAEILQRFSGEVVKAAGNELSIVEFGSGSSEKTRFILSAALSYQSTLQYAPVDISRDFLMESASALLSAYPELSITAVAGEYLEAMKHLPLMPGRKLLLFLGSNIGNFNPTESIQFLSVLSDVMKVEDRVLLGVDLAKDRQILLDAYNDASGTTAAFNKNLLKRINNELGANFNLEEFDHEAAFDEEHCRIEMRLVSMKAQEVYVPALETSFRFARGEVLRTEWSHKYTLESVTRMAESAGLEIVQCWRDSNGYFAEFLLRKGCSA